MAPVKLLAHDRFAERHATVEHFEDRIGTLYHNASKKIPFFAKLTPVFKKSLPQARSQTRPRWSMIECAVRTVRLQQPG
ncbi:hypothetical protein A8A54_19395 [Brucella pseudogrignonensis]|nr:hypothetical protein A8A54_19395 [Brucella pseudogrignonensis]